MASKVSGMIEKLTIGSTTHAIASTAYGYCETPAATPIKDVDMTGFVLYEGVTVHIKFANINSADNPKLRINSSEAADAKPIVQYGTTAAGKTSETNGWYAGAVVSFTYDGTSWVRDQGFNTDTNTLLRTYASATNINVPLIGSSSANSTTAAWGSYTSTYKNWYGVIPNDDAKRVKINLSTGHLTAPGGITSDITGNATTATKASALKSETRPTDANIAHVEDGGIVSFKATSAMTSNKPGGDGNILHFHWDTGSGWDSQLYIPDYHSGSMQWRASTDVGVWGTSWKTLLDTTNYSLYALPLSGGTMTGALKFSGNDSRAISWEDGTWYQRILTTDDTTADTAVFTFQQTSNSGGAWTDLFTIKDNGTVVATKFSGNGSELTNLNGSNISSGTVAFARLPTGTGANQVAIGNHTHGWANLTDNADSLSEGNSDWTDNTEILTSYASNNGFADTNAKGKVYRRDAIKAYNYIKGKLDSIYATQTTVNGLLAAADAMIFKGTLGTGGTITALPATHNAGWTYRVITAGTYAGKYCEVGTLIICIKDSTIAADADWTSVETNEDGAVIGPAAANSTTDNAIVRWDSTVGRVIQNSKAIVDDDGNISTTISTTGSIRYRVTNSNGAVSILTSTNRGLYDDTNSNWIIYRAQAGDHTYISQWASKGGETQPIYFNSNGEPVACTTYANATVAKAGAANLTTTANAIAYYSNTTGTFANGSNVRYLNSTITVPAGTADITATGLTIYGTSYGNAAQVLENADGKITYGDGGPQIRFSTGQDGAMIYSHHDNTSGMGAAFHFVSSQTDTAVKASGLIATTRAIIGSQKVNTSYVLYSNGATYINGATTINSTLAVNNGFQTQKFTPNAGTATAAKDNGSSSSNRYQPTLWTFNLGITTSDLTSGTVIMIKTPNGGHDYGVFISVDNGTTYKPISVSGTGRLTTHYGSGYVIMLVYDSSGQTNNVFPVAGSTSRVNQTGGCWRVLDYYDSGNDTQQLYSASGSARVAETSANGGLGLHGYTIQMMTNNLTWSSIAATSGSTAANSGVDTTKVAATANFLINSPILYMSNNNYTAPGSSRDVNGYTAIALDFRYNTTGSARLTTHRPVFLVGTPSSDGSTFQLLTSNWWTQTLPTTDDGKIYIFIGMSYSTTNIYLHPWHPIFWYKNGAVRQYTGSYAASSSTISVSRDTETTIATINHQAIKIKIPASDNTWRPLGTGADQAMAGNTNVNNVFQDAITYTDYTNWRPLIWGNSNSGTEGFTPADSTAGVFTAASLTCQPSTGTIRIMNLKLVGSASSAIAYTDGTTSKEMIKFIKGDANGHAIKIGGGALTVVGGGESAQSITPSTTAEHLYLLADNTIYIEANADTLANRIGFAVTTDGAIVPMKAESANNNKQDIGTSSNKWANVYATTFYGALSGNASSATTAKHLMNRGGDTVTIQDSAWAVQKTPSGYTNRETVWYQGWKQSGITYTPSGGSATTNTDSASIRIWLSSNNTSNDLCANMQVDGLIYAARGFDGDLRGNASTATKATQDSDGNAINTTYVKKVTSTDNAIVRFNGTSGAVQDSTSTINDNGTMTINGRLIINPKKDTSAQNYNEGIRINQSTNGWANIQFGGADESTSGTADGQWSVGRRGYAGNKVGAVGDFMIEEQDSIGVGLTLHKDSSGATFYSKLAYSKSQLKIWNDSSIAAGKSGWAINAISTMAATANNLILVGAANSSNNQAYLGFHYESSGSNNNYLTLGLYGADHLLKIFPTGQVNISTNITSSSTSTGSLVVAGGTGIAGALYVGGNIYTMGNITVGSNVTLQWNATDQSLDFIFA